MTPPELDRSHALFLDLDGTLLEIAATPDLVVVPPALPPLLSDLQMALNGAIAIVSGRSVEVIDTLLAPFVGNAAGEHGAAIRRQDGSVDEMPAGLAVPESWRAKLQDTAEKWPGVLVEEKAHGVALHYRLVPEREADVWALAREMVPDDDPLFRLIPAREAVEIGPRATSKGVAVDLLMKRLPFAGRVPVFIGDDFTDEAGMEVARRLGGIGLRVAEVFEGEPARVRVWLAANAEKLLPRQSRAGVMR